MIHTLGILHSVDPYPTVITRAIVCDIPAKTSASSFFSLGDIRLYPLLLSVIYVQSVGGNWRNFGFVIQRKWKWVTTMWNTPSDRICSVLTACALVDSSDWDSTDGSRQLHTDNWDTMSHHAWSLHRLHISFFINSCFRYIYNIIDPEFSNFRNKIGQFVLAYDRSTFRNKIRKFRNGWRVWKKNFGDTKCAGLVQNCSNSIVNALELLH